MTLYDATNKRLAVFEKAATSDFWDTQWKKENIKERVSSGKTHHFIERFTKQYAPKGGRILDGGCGTGEVVSCLQKWGYDAYGIDYAAETIQAVREMLPNLKLSVQDVKHTNFADAYFDAYWSLGVIEHFWNGYEEIVKEAHRILKPGGIFFLSFPVMSPLRKLKARLNRYPLLSPSTNTNDFYEFMLDQDIVTRELAGQGFELERIYLYDALKGLKDELPFLHLVLQKLYKSKNFLARGFRLLLTVCLGRWTGHMTVLVLRKTA